MRRHNQRIYRIVRGILKDDGESEDVMQDAYVRAHQRLAQFERRSSLVTWLTRIAMHEAFARGQRMKRQTSLDSDPAAASAGQVASPDSIPEQKVANMALHTALEERFCPCP